MTDKFKVTASSFINTPVEYSISADSEVLEVSHSLETPSRAELFGRVVVEFRKDSFALKIERPNQDDIEINFMSLRGTSYAVEGNGFVSSEFINRFGHGLCDSMIAAALGAAKKMIQEQPAQLTKQQKQLINCADRYLSAGQHRGV